MSKHQFVTPIGNDGMYILDTASWRIFRPIMDKEKCVECGMCMAYCPVGAIIGVTAKNYQITYDFCKGCGICAKECPCKAIDMKLEGADE
ncbi:4Fe-4S binding protein [Anaerotignum sp.]|uniref:4Fe-4S binding protein n=1 Tax=Anaerotignum sp. TaxID=2039241 RepID=UPI00289707AE|nr:4Fe-4S binding protein [Anaerotignum sp.]